MGATYFDISEGRLHPEWSLGRVTDRIAGIPLRQGFERRWLILFGAALSLTMLGALSIALLLIHGVGIWGVNIPVAWGFAIVNFVWWIGIGHAGTLISAILLLLRQSWRTSINRFAEAMTLFAVANAGLFPLLHLGRIWKFYYLFPYPSTLDVWPQWRSPLVWDVFAVLTYFTVSFLFWYLGLIPDLATLRDQAKRRWVARLAGFFSLGWRGSGRHWHHYQTLYLLMAGLATPLVVSVHSIVSFDFAVSVVPGWHSTVFPPFFVAGAIYSGFAMVIMLAVPLRAALGMKDFITLRHFDVMGKVMLAAGLIVAYGYVMETFAAWRSGEIAEQYLVLNRAFGPYGWAWWGTIIANVLAAQLLWFRFVRTRPLLIFAVAAVINVGMWLERFVIVIVSLHRDYLPSSWHMYYPTIWDWSLLLGTIGLFLAMMLLFVRFIPVVSIFEMREAIHHEVDPPTQAKCALVPSAEPDCPPPAGTAQNLCAEFETPEQLLRAAGALRAQGHRHIDTFSPFPLPGAAEALGLRRGPIPLCVLVGALMGALAGFALQAYTGAVDYPIAVAGRPHFSWPSYVPITFELAVLGGTLFGLIGLFVLCRLPRPFHPLFLVPGFSAASRDGFFLQVQTSGDAMPTPDDLTALGAVRVCEVPDE